MTTTAFIILALLLALQTVRVWLWKAMQRETARRWAATQTELDKAIKDRHDVQVKLNARIAGERYVEKLDEWPEEIQ
jgi:hypothetical protein